MLFNQISVCGFESHCSHFNLRYRASLDEGVLWHTANYSAHIHYKHVCDMIKTQSRQLTHLFPMHSISTPWKYQQIGQVDTLSVDALLTKKVAKQAGNLLTFSLKRSLSYRNQSIDFRCKSMDWFLYDRDLCH